MASALSERKTEPDFTHFYQYVEEDYKNYIQKDSDLDVVKKIFEVAKSSPEPTGKALKLQNRKIAIIEKDQPGAMSYLLIASGLAAFGLATSGIGPAVVGAVGGPSLFKWMNDCSVAEQTAFIKAYMKVYPGASEADLDKALITYSGIQALNIDSDDL